MRQELTTDTVERYIDARPEVLYDLIADVTRTPERTPDIARCEWIDGATALTPATAPTLRALADLEPRTLALMHGPAYAGDGRQALLDLADAYEAQLVDALPARQTEGV